MGDGVGVGVEHSGLIVGDSLPAFSAEDHHEHFGLVGDVQSLTLAIQLVL